MARRQPDFHSFKGLAPSTRQQAIEQTKTLPVSYYTEKERHTGKSFDMPRSSDILNEKNYQGKFKHRENVQFDGDDWERRFKYDEKQRETQAAYQLHKQHQKRYYPFSYRNQSYHKLVSDIEPELESVLSESEQFDTETESELPINNDNFQKSIESIEKGLHRITNNYVTEVKSQVNEALIKLKSHEKINQIPKLNKKFNSHGAGDKPNQTQSVHKKMDQVKKDCYRKIEANLELLKNIDTITDQLIKNHIIN